MKSKSAKNAPGKSADVTPTSHKNKVVVVEVSSADEREFAAAVARKLSRPEVSAAAVIECWQSDTHDVNQVVAELSRQVEAVNAGDLRRAEAMLISQAQTLDTMFSVLARRAASQEYLKQWEVYMRMGLKAQAQCRATLETLAAIKNPPVVFARQANINNGGQQQVNNGAQPAQQPAQVQQQREGASETLAPPAAPTAPDPTQGFSPPCESNQGAGALQQVTGRRG